MTDKAKIAYHDLHFRIVLGLIAAHIIVMFNEEVSFFEVLFTIPYLRAMAGSFLIAMLLIQYIHYITVRLDAKHDWQDATLQRLFYQVLLGFLAPAIFAFVLASFFFWIFGLNILKTTYLREDYTLIVFMLVAINVYYFGLHSFLRYRQLTDVRGSVDHDELAVEGTAHKLQQPAESKSAKEVLIIDTPVKSFPVRTENIAYCYIMSGLVFMRTFEMSTLNESYQVSSNLKMLEKELNEKLFFRINRQMIVNFNACKSFKPGKNKTLDLIIDPVPYTPDIKVPAEHERLCVVSEDRATVFKAWMNR